VNGTGQGPVPFVIPVPSILAVTPEASGRVGSPALVPGKLTGRSG
jgi:hypothetical protein